MGKEGQRRSGMALSKPICKRCWARQYEYGHTWTFWDDIRWDMGKVICPPGTGQFEGRSTDVVPSGCLYAAEHTVSREPEQC